MGHRLLSSLELGLVFFGAAARLLPHPPNVAPIAAMALFGGAHLGSPRAALVIPLAAMVLSDLFLGFHSTVPFVYAAFLAVGLLGLAIRRRKTVATLGVAAVAASLLFFLLTNFGSWLVMPAYPKTLEGLLAAYFAGLPFFRNTLLGDLAWTAFFFGAASLARMAAKGRTPWPRFATSKLPSSTKPS